MRRVVREFGHPVSGGAPPEDERELTAPVALCTPDGRLHPDAVGWSRRPVHDCRLPGSWGRRKRWDYWCVTAPGHVLSVTYADVDYLGTADVWFLDLATGRTFRASASVPLARGFAMPDTVGGGSMALARGSLRVGIEEVPGGTRLTAAATTRDGSLECDVLVARPAGLETLSVVIPWSERRFQCTTKENSRPASGTVRVDRDEYRFDPDGESWGCLDYGRGKWPYRTLWNWGSAAGHQHGHVVGLQLGGKWTDGTGMTENALCVDGRLSKISEELVWEYDRSDWLRPWRIRAPRSGAVDLTFTPVHDKVSTLQAGVAASRVHQCFGHYAGRVTPAGGGPIPIEGLFGWAEEARWRW